MRKNERKKRLVVAVIAILLIVMMVLGLTVSMVAAEEETASEATSLEAVAVESSKEPIVARGVYIDNIDVTNMTLSEAEKALNAHMENLRNDTITFYAGHKTATVKAGDLGLDYANKSVVQEALSIGKKGNVFKRFLADKEIREEGPIVLDLDLTVSRSKVATAVREKKAILDCEAKSNAMILNEDDTFSLLPPENGIRIHESNSIDAVQQYMNEAWHGGEGGVRLEAQLLTTSDTSDQLRHVRNRLGKSVTYFDATDENRTTNITLAASCVDGTILYPGEEFSALEVIGDTTEEKGYALGASFGGDRIIETYGGGVCQVTSTLYCAVLEAELEVTERHNHTMRIHYLDPGFDATMSEDSVDFRFLNSTEKPIYIQATVEEGELEVQIYGEETRDPERSISYESRILTTTDYRTVYRVDETAEFGTISEIYGEEGVQAELWKVIYKNGEYESEEKVNTSIYSPLNHTYSVGTVGASGDTITAIYNAVGSGSLTNIYNAVGNGTRIEQVTIQDD